MLLSHKLALSLGLPVLALVAVGAFSERWAHEALVAAIERSGEERGEALLDEIDRLLQARVAEWRAFAGGTEVQTELERSTAALATRLDREEWMIAQDGAWRVGRENGTACEALLAVQSSPLTSRMSEYLAQLEAVYGYAVYGEAFVTDAWGVNVAQTNTTSDFRQDDEVWWQRAKSDGQYVGEVRYDESAGIYSTELCLRIDSRDGEFLGVLKAALDIHEAVRLLEQCVERGARGAPAAARLMNRDLHLIYATTHAGAAREDGKALLAGFGLPLPERITTGRREGESGQRWISTLIPSRADAAGAGAGWILLLEIDEAAAMQPVFVLQKLIWSVTALVVVLTLLLGTAFVRDVTTRVRVLTEAAKRLGRGNSYARAEIGGRDELTQLATSFNGMADILERDASDLKERAESLDQKNAELAHEMTEREAAQAAQRRLEGDLAGAQKLEAIGRLAAGIAHEINTPAQYVGDNLRFLVDSVAGLLDLARALPALLANEQDGELKDAARAILKAHDLEFLAVEVPGAVKESLEGIGRITTIVKAMKDFSHPGTDDLTHIDLNAALRSTATVGRNEWKYVADLEFDLEPDLPRVVCIPGEVNQVFLNMIVNAAHAIADVVGADGEKGTITISTRSEGDHVDIRIADTGTGMSTDVAERIFDPFFTTKGIGRGTGQGLAIAHAVIVKRHGGRIDVESTPGRGTAFIVRLPIDLTENVCSLTSEVGQA